MNRLLFLSFLLSTACFDSLTAKDDPDDDEERRREGDQQGDCFDGEDNDDDDNIDCDDSGCADKPACIDTDTATEPGSEPGTEPGSEPDTGTGSLAPDYLLYKFANAYENGDISSAEVDGNDLSGFFSAILYDSASEDYCALDWVVNSSTTSQDSEFNDGSVPGADGNPIDAWFGFIIDNGSPTTRGNCNLSPSGAEYLNALQSDTPGFGYGPLTPSLEESMEGSNENYVFSGIISSVALTGGDRGYYAINESFAYPINNGVTSWDTSIQNGTQGGELNLSSLPSDGFYVGNTYFAFGI